MGEHMVKVMGLIRAICGTRVTFLSFGTREYRNGIRFYKIGLDLKMIQSAWS